MTTRLLLAYVLMAAVAAGIFAALWLSVLRERWVWHRRHRRARLDKARAARPTYEAD